MTASLLIDSLNQLAASRTPHLLWRCRGPMGGDFSRPLRGFCILRTGPGAEAPGYFQSPAVAWSYSFRISPITPKPSHLLLQNVERCLVSFGSRTRNRIFTQSMLNQVVQRSQLAHRIGSAGVSGEQKSLAAAAAEILLAAIAGAAGFGHPLFTAKFLEGCGTLPDPTERVVADIIEAHAWNHSCRMTGQRAACGIDQEQLASPAAHAGFGETRVVIGDDHVDANLAMHALLSGGDHDQGTIELRARGQQCRAILKRPAVVLRVRDFHAIGMKRFQRGDHLFEVINVLAVNNQIGSEGDAMFADPRGQLDFVGVGPRARD